nr:DUF1294 domain-containing protein [uncultured Neisseria sp.]
MRSLTFALCISSLFLSITAVILPKLAIAYLVLSACVFLLYHQDKQRARNHGRRIPEAKLHLLNLLGGWPGGYCGSLAFRHKTSKPEFVRTFRLSAATNTAATLLLLADTLKHSNQ